MEYSFHFPWKWLGALIAALCTRERYALPCVMLACALLPFCDGAIIVAPDWIVPVMARGRHKTDLLLVDGDSQPGLPQSVDEAVFIAEDLWVGEIGEQIGVLLMIMNLQ